MQKVGYLYNTEKGPIGEPGIFYDYIVASNGLFIQAQNPFIKATVAIASANVRGLSPLWSKVELAHGKIPGVVLALATGTLNADPFHERYVAVVWDNGYHLKVPQQVGGGASVEYERLPNTVVEFHSHSTMSSFFSGTDTRDEQGFGVYVVVGRLDMLIPETQARIGVYGYFASLNLDEVFDVHTRKPIH